MTTPSERERAEWVSGPAEREFCMWMTKFDPRDVNKAMQYIIAMRQEVADAAHREERKRCAEIAQNIKLKYRGQPVHDAIADEIRALDKEAA